MDEKTELLSRFFAAINRNDIQAAAEFFHPDIVRVEPEGFPTAGTYSGIADVQAHIAKGRGIWAEGSCEPEKFLVRGERIVVFLHAWVRLEHSADWGGGRFADGFEFRDGRIVRYLSFAERTDALAWAGIEADDVV
ncbi:MAG: nuclear transport factor 2 family protein [Pseudomonadales bacterium]